MVHPLGDGDPTRIGPYELFARLGGGGMGRVFAGRSPGGRLVAVKVVRPELADDPEFRRRFAVEVAAARKVGGFYTAQVVDADPDGDQPWLATAYIPGPSLQTAVTEHGPLPPAAVARLGAGLTEGLAAVHAHGLVHRDLKPANVLVAEDGPRLIDFGIARALDTTSHTRTATVLGTAAFMSPEQVTAQQVGPASDVFSLGCVLAFAATGRSPFGEGPLHSVVYRVVHADPDLSDLPAPLVDVVAACVAKDPAARPTLDRLLADLTALAPPGQTPLHGGWLPDQVTEVITRQRTLLLTLTSPPTEPPASAGESRDDGPQPRSGAAEETDSRGNLTIGNFSPAFLSVTVDGTALDTVPPNEIRTFSLAPGWHALLVQAPGRRDVLRRVEVKTGATTRLAFDLPKARRAEPHPVQAVTFTESKLRELVFGAVSGLLLVAVVFGMIVLATTLAEAGLPDWKWDETLSTVGMIGLGLGLFLGLRAAAHPSRLTVRSSGMAMTATFLATPQKWSWNSIGQVSVINYGRSDMLVLWPRKADTPLRGANGPDGTVRYHIKGFGVRNAQARERFHLVLRWFANDLYLEQPE